MHFYTLHQTFIENCDTHNDKIQPMRLHHIFCFLLYINVLKKNLGNLKIFVHSCLFKKKKTDLDLKKRKIRYMLKLLL